MTRKPYEQGRIFIGRLPRGADVVASITKLANEEEIKLGKVDIYGVVARASVATFNVATKMTLTVEREEAMEIAAMSGTISQFKGRSMARLSGTLVGSGGAMIAGSIGLGTRAHACEVVITEYVGGTLARDFDIDTGLPLWKESSLLVEAPAAEQS